MSIRRLVGTAMTMAGIAAGIGAFTPGIAPMAADLAAAQHTVDTAGADALVVSAAGLLAWAVWAWGAAGLALTAASALPGLPGAAARAAQSVVLPAAARRSAALALGLGLGVAGPVLGTTTVMAASPASATAPAPLVGDVPDWPAAAPAPAPPPPVAASAVAHRDDAAVPDWPDRPHPAGAHVVVRGDCLWQIAGDRLGTGLGERPTNAEVAVAVHAWWTANRAVIGPDPDLLLPGQVLRPPPAR